MTDLTALTERICDRIPLTRQLGFTLAEHRPGQLRMTAPLAPHINDKGTFFAGSQSALLTLAGWSLTTLEAEAVNSDLGNNVVAVESSLRYLAPLAADAVITARASDDALTLFRERYARKGKAVLLLTVTLCDPHGKLASEFDAVYLARRVDPAH